ncbi:hypothetical protein, partial [Paenibacillus faecis]|uniref:hypothetical protein n=1 Tax=Paenibacillus faecis TaxID=862114 RepID=UPI001B860616
PEGNEVFHPSDALFERALAQSVTDEKINSHIMDFQTTQGRFKFHHFNTHSLFSFQRSTSFISLSPHQRQLLYLTTSANLIARTNSYQFAYRATVEAAGVIIYHDKRSNNKV